MFERSASLQDLCR